MAMATSAEKALARPTTKSTIAPRAVTERNHLPYIVIAPLPRVRRSKTHLIPAAARPSVTVTPGLSSPWSKPFDDDRAPGPRPPRDSADRLRAVRRGLGRVRQPRALLHGVRGRGRHLDAHHPHLPERRHLAARDQHAHLGAGLPADRAPAELRAPLRRGAPPQGRRPGGGARRSDGAPGPGRSRASAPPHRRVAGGGRARTRAIGVAPVPEGPAGKREVRSSTPPGVPPASLGRGVARVRELAEQAITWRWTQWPRPSRSKQRSG